MVTKPQDIIVALKLALGATASGYADLGVALGMSASEVHAAVGRLIQARLLDPETKRVRFEALRNFLVHGVPYAFPANLEEITRGMPTAWAAPAMSGMISSSDQLPPVWPDPEGRVQGTSVQPLYPSVPGGGCGGRAGNRRPGNRRWSQSRRYRAASRRGRPSWNREQIRPHPKAAPPGRWERNR